jgi:hypothetical protein
LFTFCLAPSTPSPRRRWQFVALCRWLSERLCSRRRKLFAWLYQRRQTRRLWAKSFHARFSKIKHKTSHTRSVPVRQPSDRHTSGACC